MRLSLIVMLNIATCMFVTSCAPKQQGEIRGDIHNFGPNQMDDAGNYLMGTFEDGFCIVLIAIEAPRGWSAGQYNTQAINGVVRRTVKWQSSDEVTEMVITIISRHECYVGDKQLDLAGGRLVRLSLDEHGRVDEFDQSVVDTQNVVDAESAEKIVADAS